MVCPFYQGQVFWPRTMSFTSKPVFLPDLALVAGHSKIPWCPVLALKWYLKRIERLLTSQQLFISVNAQHGPATRDTILAAGLPQLSVPHTRITMTD